MTIDLELQKITKTLLADTEKLSKVLESVMDKTTASGYQAFYDAISTANSLEKYTARIIELHNKGQFFRKEG